MMIMVDMSNSFILDNLVLFARKEQLFISTHWEGRKLLSGKRTGRHQGKRRKEKSMGNFGKTSKEEVFVLFRQITFPYSFYYEKFQDTEEVKDEFDKYLSTQPTRFKKLLTSPYLCFVHSSAYPSVQPSMPVSLSPCLYLSHSINPFIH